MKNLVIVESPSKSKTIEKYLGKEYKVVSSKGHIRDLATTGKYGLGVDVENNFKPTYIPLKGKKKDIASLKKQAIEADKVYLATDPDREGEAISWHLKDELDIDDNKYERVVFNEITKDVILNSFNNTRKIDQNLVNSQEARRILDRIIGFRLSKLMQSKTGGKSAGRVQSVALKLIVDREREIEAFKEVQYFEIDALFKDFETKLFGYKKDKLEMLSKSEADEILSKLSNAFKIESVDKKKKNKRAKFPYITSTLQQDASSKIGFSAKKTMSVAQKLYEGINLGNETVGLITYMRTDSTRLSDDFIKSTFKYINDNYGSEYIGSMKISKKTDNVQDAHEAIRPTSILKEPDKIKDYLTKDEYKLYSLIYYRALASLMADAKTETTTIIFDNNDYKFKTTGSVLTYDGYLKVYKDYEDRDDKILPSFEKYHTDIVLANKIEISEHFTKGPSRYTESSLIKDLEELGIGRPSTYAKIIDTLRERSYVTIIEKKFQPTEIGILSTDKLQEYFSDIVNVEYTANMEDNLDLISIDKKVWYEVLKEFYEKFEPEVLKAFNEMEKIEPSKTGELCPECESPLVVRRGKYGEFVACSNYPKCKYIKSEQNKPIEVAECPKCGGKIVEKKTRKGKIFYGCNSYPKCDYALWYKPTGDKCPKCGGLIVENKQGLVCNDCKEVIK